MQTMGYFKHHCHSIYKHKFQTHNLVVLSRITKCYVKNSVTDDGCLEGDDDALRGTVESWCWPWVGKSSSVTGENRTRAVDMDAIELLSLADI